VFGGVFLYLGYHGQNNLKHAAYVFLGHETVLGGVFYIAQQECDIQASKVLKHILATFWHENIYNLCELWIF
jgi:hypothetical protein